MTERDPQAAIRRTSNASQPPRAVSPCHQRLDRREIPQRGQRPGFQFESGELARPEINLASELRLTFATSDRYRSQMLPQSGSGVRLVWLQRPPSSRTRQRLVQQHFESFEEGGLAVRIGPTNISRGVIGPPVVALEAHGPDVARLCHDGPCHLGCLKFGHGVKGGRGIANDGLVRKPSLKTAQYLLLFLVPFESVVRVVPHLPLLRAGTM